MWVSLGKITVPAAGTPIRATANETTPEQRFAGHAVLFQAWPTNAGKIWVMARQTANKTTGAGVLAILAIPTANSIPSASASVTFAPVGFNVNEIWIDADTNGDGCLISVLLA